MILLITSGAASGKSEYAEECVVQSGLSPRLYVAAMEIFGAEDEARAARHRALRAGKGFQTLECPRALASADIPPCGAALLECLTTLTANECFSPQYASPKGFDGAVERVMAGIWRLAEKSALTVLVAGDLTSDGGSYDPLTTRYLEAHASVLRQAAALADAVIEVVYGIPVPVKGGLPF